MSSDKIKGKVNVRPVMLGKLYMNPKRPRQDQDYPFRPSDLSPVLWLNADDGLFTTFDGDIESLHDGDPVGRWVSLDDTANGFIQDDDGERPTLELAVANGRKIVRLGSTAAHYVEGTNTVLTGNFTLYMAGVISSDSFQFGTETGSGAIQMAPGDTVGVRDDDGNDVSDTGTFSAGPVIGRFVRDSNVITFACTGENQVTLGTLSGTITINELLYGDRRHVLLFDRVLTTSEQEQVESYLESDMGVTLP